MKYFNPKSLTWWASFLPLMAGLIGATEPVHGAIAVVQTIDNITGGAAPTLLINAGLAGIGIRGALQSER